ncbi:MAG: RNA 2',3'-cyclic phosphodiesterase [Nitrospirota bacterium]
MDKIRSFIAIDIKESIRVEIGNIQKRIKEIEGLQIRWVRPDGIHLTLKFMGDIAFSDIDRIKELLNRSVSGFSPLFIKIKGIGIFPDMRRPRVIWMGIEGDRKELIRLQNRVEKGLSDMGYPEEKRRFTPHLTIGRIKSVSSSHIKGPQFNDIIEELKYVEAGEFQANSVTLLKSELKPSGAVYTKLGNFKMESDAIYRPV